MALIKMLSLMKLDYESKMLEFINIPQDYHYRTDVTIGWRNIEEHPQTIELDRELGYSFDEDISLDRYRKPLKKRIVSKIPIQAQRTVKALIPSRIQKAVESLIFNLIDPPGKPYRFFGPFRFSKNCSITDTSLM